MQNQRGTRLLVAGGHRVQIVGDDGFRMGGVGKEKGYSWKIHSGPGPKNTET